MSKIDDKRLEEKLKEWELLKWDKTSKLAEMAQNGQLITEFMDAVEALKECRASKVSKMIENWKQIDEYIEQRTKERCIKAGWEWIVKRIPPKYIPNDDEASFKQANYNDQK